MLMYGAQPFLGARLCRSQSLPWRPRCRVSLLSPLPDHCPHVRGQSAGPAYFQSFEPQPPRWQHVRWDGRARGSEGVAGRFVRIVAIIATISFWPRVAGFWMNERAGDTCDLITSMVAFDGRGSLSVSDSVHRAVAFDVYGGWHHQTI